MYYAANRHRKLTAVTPLVMAQIRSQKPGYPVLKSSAAGCRHLCDFGLALAHMHLRGDGGRGSLRLRTARMGPRSADVARLQVKVFEGVTRYHRACAEEPFEIQECKQALHETLSGMQELHRTWRLGASI